VPLGGFVPDMALFIDGLNEFAFSWPGRDRRLEAVFSGKEGWSAPGPRSRIYP
jgi:hypothetical protein